MEKLELSVLFRRDSTSQFFLYFSEFFWTINYRYLKVSALLLVEAHEMSKSLNLP